MNRKQWHGIYVALAALAVVIFLHSPLTGYQTSFYFEYTKSSGDLPFWEWRAKAPLLPWLGSLENLAASVLLIAVLLAIWVVANRQEAKQPPRSDA